MSEAVYKARITIDVMGVADSAQDFRTMLENMSLADILHDADEEGLIRSGHGIASVEHVHKDDVGDELKRIGNDGTFFDDQLQDWPED